MSKLFLNSRFILVSFDELLVIFRENIGFFHSFWVAIDLIRCPGVLGKIFAPLGVHRGVGEHRVPNLGSLREQITVATYLIPI